VDRAGILTPAARESLEQSLAAFEAKTGHQIVVHTTPSLEGLPIEDYSMRIAEAWKIGQKGLDNGVILTVAPKERELRIEVGYGLEGVLPDAIASRIIRERITPEFRAGRVDAGIEAGVAAIEAVVEGEQLPLPQHPDDGFRRYRTWFRIAWVLFLLLIVFTRTPLFWALFGLPGVGRRGGGRRGGFRGGPFLGGGGFGGGGFGGGGFGGGGFSGGGGGFGGGGASGRW
jgi:uncharacterized protein